MTHTSTLAAPPTRRVIDAHQAHNYSREIDAIEGEEGDKKTHLRVDEERRRGWLRQRQLKGPNMARGGE